MEPRRQREKQEGAAAMKKQAVPSCLKRSLSTENRGSLEKGEVCVRVSFVRQGEVLPLLSQRLESVGRHGLHQEHTAGI